MFHRRTEQVILACGLIFSSPNLQTQGNINFTRYQGRIYLVLFSFWHQCFPLYLLFDKIRLEFKLYADLAQWQSSCFVNSRSSVRIRQSAQYQYFVQLRWRSSQSLVTVDHAAERPTGVQIPPSALYVLQVIDMAPELSLLQNYIYE